MIKSFPVPMRIAIDIDEVLCPFFSPMVRRSGRPLPRGKHPYDYSEALGITSSESKMMVSEFYTSDTFRNLLPIEESQHYIRRLKNQGFTMYTVTGRQTESRDETEKWLDRHFPGMFKDLVMSNSYTDYEVPKIMLCKSLAIDVIVDDNFHTCIECENHGLQSINYVGDPLYPWCVNGPMATRNWEEAYKKIINM